VRPVNLIPPEERHGERAPLRSGPFSYAIVAGLALALAAVSALVLTSNSISDRKAEVADLQAQEAEVKAQAESLGPFAEFASMAQAREQTVTSLAHSRFDWERVLRELALVIPDDVWLVELTGTAGPDVELENAAEISLQTDVAGPSLAMIGCATSHEAVAGFLQALKDIDGVTRVGLAKSERSATADAGTGSVESDCRTRDFIARFEIIAAFDEAAVPAVASGAAPATPTTPSTTTPSATPAASDGSGVPEAQAEEQEARDSSAEQTNKARNATDTLIPGVTR
jgi:Tfp pilus assembly protein PilN